MSTLWVFNPENDIALATNLRHFTAPRNATLLREAGALLPLWMAKDGDIIYARQLEHANWLQRMCGLTGCDVGLLTARNVSNVDELRPWGWSLAIAEELTRTGIDPRLMPDSHRIEKIRQLSHRRSSIIINSRLRDMGFDAIVPAEITDVAELERMTAHDAGIVVKSPWSSSGRGVLYSGTLSHRQLIQMAEGIINHQGSVTVEKCLDKVIDFAMLFEIRSGIARYVGLSVFDTSQSGNYSGNIVASQQYLTNLLSKHVDTAVLVRLQKALEETLTEMTRDAYNGICGVDMMIHTGPSGKPSIAPCIELNLRCTMGYVAYCLHQRLLRPDAAGKFAITYTGNRDAPVDSNPYVISSDGRLTEGVLSLIPESPHFDISLTVATPSDANGGKKSIN